MYFKASLIVELGATVTVDKMPTLLLPYQWFRVLDFNDSAVSFVSCGDGYNASIYKSTHWSLFL